ncbi:AMP-binding protein [Pirellulaceae bacterium SH449]
MPHSPLPIAERETLPRLYDYCNRNANDSPNTICFLDRDGDNGVLTWSWADIHRETLIVAFRFHEQGIKSGSRIINGMRNSREWILVELACSFLNAIHAPIDPRIPLEQARAMVADLQPDLVIVDDQADLVSENDRCLHLCRPNISEWIQSCSTKSSKPGWEPEDFHGNSDDVFRSFSETDIANILFTSGTTSRPKGVMLSHRNLVSNAIAKLDAMPQFAADHRLNVLPFSHAYAKTCELATWLISASSLEILNSSSMLLERMRVAKPTLLNAVPILYMRIHTEWVKRGGEALALHELTGGRMRQLASGGAPLEQALRSAFAEAGMPIYQGYGLTEAGPVVCSNRSGAIRGGADQRLNGVGPVVPGMELRIDDDGRLWVRGTGVMMGYWNDPVATQNRIIDGWLDTGDVAEQDESGCVRILGRSDDTIVLENGYKVDPLTTEQLLCGIAGVRDCLLVPSSPTGYEIIILSDTNIGPSDCESIRRQVSELLAATQPVRANRILIASDDWTEANGLRNFKGAKHRRNIRNHYATSTIHTSPAGLGGDITD